MNQHSRKDPVEYIDTNMDCLILYKKLPFHALSNLQHHTRHIFRFCIATGGRYFLCPVTTYHTVANTVIPPNMAIFQFIVVTSTGVAIGKKQNTKKAQRKHSAMVLMVRPQRPSEKPAGGRGSLRSRLRNMHPMESM